MARRGTIRNAGEPFLTARDDDTATLSVQTLVDGTTAHILKPALMGESIQTWPPHYELLLSILARGQHAAIRHTTALATLTVAERLERTLVLLATCDPRHQVNLTHEVLAELVAADRARVSGALSVLLRQGLIVTTPRRRGLSVLPALLERVSASG